MRNGAPARVHDDPPLRLLTPEDVDALPLRLLPTLIAELAGLQARAAARLRESDASPEPERNTDRLLDVREAAARLGMSADWVYRHAHRLPFTRRNGRRAVRFSERGLDAYLKQPS
jgi:excisionase family DNA binding protein